MRINLTGTIRTHRPALMRVPLLCWGNVTKRESTINHAQKFTLPDLFVRNL
jgi:hypothetical protein